MQCQFCSRVFVSNRRVHRYNFSFPTNFLLVRDLCAECADVTDSYLGRANIQCSALVAQLVSEAAIESKRVNLPKPV